MKTDPFEERLRAQSLRPVPPGWRGEILAAARAGAREEDSGCSRGGADLRWLRAWLWPHPAAWAGLAACWIAVAALHQAAAPSPAEVAQSQENAWMAAAYSTLLRGPAAAALTVEPPPVNPTAPPRRRTPDQGRRVVPSTFSLA